MAVEVVLRPTSRLGEGSLIHSAESREPQSSKDVAELQWKVAYLCEQVWNGGTTPDMYLHLVAEELMTLAERLLAQPGAARFFAHYPLATAYVALGMPSVAIAQIVTDGLAELDSMIEMHRQSQTEDTSPEEMALLRDLLDERDALSGLTQESAARAA